MLHIRCEAMCTLLFVKNGNSQRKKTAIFIGRDIPHSSLNDFTEQVPAQLSLRNSHDVMFARYSPSNYRVTLKLGVGHSRSSEVAPFGSSGMVSYLNSRATMVVSHTVSEIGRLIGKKSPNFLIPCIWNPR